MSIDQIYWVSAFIVALAIAIWLSRLWHDFREQASPYRKQKPA